MMCYSEVEKLINFFAAEVILNCVSHQSKDRFPIIIDYICLRNQNVCLTHSILSQFDLY